MSMDYEELANKNNPFEGLSQAESDQLIIYLTYVREPVLTLKEIKANWGVQMSDKDIPLFEATRIADQIRYEIKKRSESVQRSRNRLIALGCVTILVLVIIEAFRIPRQLMIDNSSRIAKQAQDEAAKCQVEMTATKADCRKKIDEANRIAAERVSNAEQKEKGSYRQAQDEIAATKADCRKKIDEANRIAAERVSDAGQKAKDQYRKVLSDYVSVGLAGNAGWALAEIKAAIQNVCENPSCQVEGDLAALIERARVCVKAKNCSSAELFQSGQSLKEYLVRHQEINEAERLDVTDLMINCYKRSLGLGFGKAGYELFILYGGEKFCRQENSRSYYSKYRGEWPFARSELVVAENQLLSWTALEKASSLINYEALSVMLFLSQYKGVWRRYRGFQEYSKEVFKGEGFKESHAGICFRCPDEDSDYDRIFLVALANHMNVTPVQLNQIAQVHLGFDKRFQPYAVKVFRRASARGNVDAKNWLLANGYSFDE